MKTKIVYVLTSNDNDVLLEQLMLSLHSLKYHNPSAEVFLVVDQDTYLSINGNRSKIKAYLTDIIAIDTPKEFNNMLRSRWLKTSLREYIDGDYLFVDSDTIVTDSLAECDNWNIEIGAVMDRHIPVDKSHQYHDYICESAKNTDWTFEPTDSCYFNSGVMFVKDNVFTHSFYKKWHENWMKGIRNKVYQDQPTLGKTNKYFGYVIKKIDDEWNCQIMANGIKYLSTSKIIHYFNAERQSEKKSVFYLPSDRELYHKIKLNSFILDSATRSLIENGRSAFADNYAVFADEQLAAIRDSFSQFVLNGFYAKNFYYKFLKALYVFFVKMKSL